MLPPLVHGFIKINGLEYLPLNINVPLKSILLELSAALGTEIH